MSTLWTPSGEQPAEAEPGSPEQAAAREQLGRIREELAETPVRDIVVNHAIGLWQLAILHLGLDDPDAKPNLTEAKLAIDALASLVDGVLDRLGEHADPLKDALTNLRIAFVRVSEDTATSGDTGDSDP